MKKKKKTPLENEFKPELLKISLNQWTPEYDHLHGGSL
jgi:hypothetical protein